MMPTALLLTLAALVPALQDASQEEAQEGPEGASEASPQEPEAGKLNLEAPDGLPITAEYRPAGLGQQAPLLVLFHQARSSRGEYRPIQAKLTELGFRTLAVDLRSGGRMNDVKNGTNRYARQSGRGTNFVDALPDMLTALEYARRNIAPDGTALVAWGSSYSASLVLHVASERPELVDGVVSFSPGEYFKALGKGETWIEGAAAGVVCPTFLTGAKAEAPQWRAFLEAIPEDRKVGFEPEGKGGHGSRALWPESEGNGEYWKALEAFLDQYFPRAKTAHNGED